MNQPQSNTVIRLSLRWVLVALLAMLAVGILGGMIGSQLNNPRTPLTRQQDQLVTTVQEVTISPSKTSQTIVRDHERSVLLLAQGSFANPTILGTATVITNDGLITAFHPPVRGEVFALDSGGNRVTLEAIGADTLFGLTYYRIRDGVIAPLNISESDPAVGAELLSLSRSPESLQPEAEHHELSEKTLAETGDPVGWQQVGLISISEQNLAGTILVDDTGAISGIYTGPQSSEAGRILLPSDIRASLNRIASGKREENPFATRGFSVRSSFTSSDESQPIVFTLTVDRLQPGTPASELLEVGDILTAIQNQPVSFTNNAASMLSIEGELSLTVRREGREVVVTLP
ncbi:MAG: hypothetical protein HYR90_03800 [Candidatus Andersenbacteria bacterium]|nr:hypothetical protein [Candidatus Andersenbacteria bacterium]MBI3250386.1 hypothetical protein [Candidatus Andersenbacteria bacterium]